MNAARSCNRRDFLRHAIAASLLAGTAISRPGLLWAQACATEDLPRTLVNFMLQGGADFRYLFMPPPNYPDAVYVQLGWAARRSLYSNDYVNYEQMFDNEYLLATDPWTGAAFGIHRQAGWLKSEFDAGRVAVVANAYCSRNRRHDQSILNADAGEPDYDVLNFDRDGWGGRLVEYLGPGLNSVELGSNVSTFNKGSVPGSRLARVVHAEDMRDLALPQPNPEAPASRESVLARALAAYYRARGPEVTASKPANWPYHQYFQHYAALSDFGGAVEQKLSACQTLPDALVNLQLSDPDFAQQCRNLFDVCQVPAALGLGVVSMNYGGWDTHNNQAAEIGRNLSDVFGSGGGLDTALSEIRQLPGYSIPPAEQMAFCFASDFGRQIIANGAAGTDHGSGTYSLLIGHSIRGGVYGEMFPARESHPDQDGQVPLETPGADIEGLTSSDRILRRAAGWVRAGAGEAVFPGSIWGGIEAGVDVDAIFPV